jgi:hypothetical protein
MSNESLKKCGGAMQIIAIGQLQRASEHGAAFTRS